MHLSLDSLVAARVGLCIRCGALRQLSTCVIPQPKTGNRTDTVTDTGGGGTTDTGTGGGTGTGTLTATDAGTDTGTETELEAV